MAKKKRPEIDKAAVEAAKEMVAKPNTDWDLPSRRDEVLAVARNYLALLELLKIEKQTSKALRAGDPIKKYEREMTAKFKVAKLADDYIEEMEERSKGAVYRKRIDEMNDWSMKAAGVRGFRRIVMDTNFDDVDLTEFFNAIRARNTRAA